MSLPRIRSDLHGQVDELFAADFLRSTDAQNQMALKCFLSSAYSSLASLAWHLGADGHVFQRESQPATDLVDDAFFELNRECEFGGGADANQVQQQLGTHNSRQQFGGAL